MRNATLVAESMRLLPELKVAQSCGVRVMLQTTPEKGAVEWAG